jgi:hypothetical protein
MKKPLPARLLSCVREYQYSTSASSATGAGSVSTSMSISRTSTLATLDAGLRPICSSAGTVFLLTRGLRWAKSAVAISKRLRNSFTASSVVTLRSSNSASSFRRISSTRASCSSIVSRCVRRSFLGRWWVKENPRVTSVTVSLDAQESLQSDIHSKAVSGPPQIACRAMEEIHLGGLEGHWLTSKC